MDLRYNGDIIPVRVLKSVRAVRCSMRVSEDGVEVKAPVFQSEPQLHSFLSKHRKWILRNYAKFKKLSESVPALRDGELVPFRGGLWRVEPADGDSGFIDEAFKYSENGDGSDADAILAALSDAYVAAAVEELRFLMEKWRNIFRPSTISFRLKEMGSRWGSCSSNGAVSINWRLIMARPEVYEYVFIHEICHLNHRGHDRKFWRAVHSRLPDAPCLRAELRRDNHKLMNFPFKPTAPKTLAVLKENG